MTCPLPTCPVPQVWCMQAQGTARWQGHRLCQPCHQTGPDLLRIPSPVAAGPWCKKAPPGNEGRTPAEGISPRAWHPSPAAVPAAHLGRASWQGFLPRAGPAANPWCRHQSELPTSSPRDQDILCPGPDKHPVSKPPTDTHGRAQSTCSSKTLKLSCPQAPCLLCSCLLRLVSGQQQGSHLHWLSPDVGRQKCTLNIMQQCGTAATHSSCQLLSVSSTHFPEL